LAWRVSLSAPAEKDAYAAFERIREAAPAHAEKWLNGVIRSHLQARKPARTVSRYSGIEGAWLSGPPSSVWKRAVWKRESVCRIIFDIRENDRHVRILRIWHASRDAITAADVED
jgi:plasmid stabilization system protein ParE